jgi:hypothetical protein
MERDALQRLAERAVRRPYRRGEVIFREGDPGEALFVVIDGLVKVYVTSPAGDEMLLVTLGPSSVPPVRSCRTTRPAVWTSAELSRGCPIGGV